MHVWARYSLLLHAQYTSFSQSSVVLLRWSRTERTKDQQRHVILSYMLEVHLDTLMNTQEPSPPSIRLTRFMM